MLVLIAGITGMCGQACARAALDKGYQVRGSGRSPDKLHKDIASKLESFVQLKDMFDTQALDKSVKGVDAVVSCLTYLPEVVVAGQLALLLAAERAGIKIFHGASWNYDWTKLSLGDHEAYDPYICFKRTAELFSTIKPIYGITGGILEYVWFVSERPNQIDKANKSVVYFGDGNIVQRWISVRDLAEYTIAAISEPDAAKGGLYYVESFHCSVLEMGRIYGQARGLTMTPKCIGDQHMLDAMLDHARQETPLVEFPKYVGLAYAKYVVNGKYNYEPRDSDGRWAKQVKQTSFQQWLEQNPEA